MGLMMCDGKFVGRDEIVNVPTPEGTASWHPVAHGDVIAAVAEAIRAKNWQILDEQYDASGNIRPGDGIPPGGRGER
ncbi:MAG: hypothetical protein IJS01_10360 [Lentisphaeria bacterium]|nr:hypothetical protein [Lentisphaeria bacterium]